MLNLFQRMINLPVTFNFQPNPLSLVDLFPLHLFDPAIVDSHFSVSET